MADAATTSLTYVSTSDYHAGRKAAGDDEGSSDKLYNSFPGGSGKFQKSGERTRLLPGKSGVEAGSGKQGQLRRQLTLTNAVGLIVGSIIGSGIFITPNQVLEQTGSVGVSFFIWIACGILACGGALCFCELGTCIPNAGATYAYILRAFGGLPAFLYVWTAGFVIRPASRAIISLAFAEYLARPFYDDTIGNGSNTTNSTLNSSYLFINPEDDFNPEIERAPTWLLKLLAALCVVALGLINIYSVRLMALVQDISMVIKLLAIVLLITTGLVFIGQGNHENINNFMNGTDVTAERLGKAFYGGLFSYDGWDSLFFAAEEVDNVAKVFPLAVKIAMGTVIFAYMLANLAYMSLLSAKEIIDTTVIAVDAVRPVLGVAGALYVMPLLVAVSTFGATNGATFVAGRQTFAAAREGSFPEFLAVVHNRWKTPIASLIFQSLIAIFYLIPSDIGTLLDIFSFAAWIFYGLCFVGLIVLRFREPHLERPYKVFIFIPVLMILASLYLVIAPFFDDPYSSLYVTAGIIGGIPVYFLFVYERTSPGFFRTVSSVITRYTLIICASSLPAGDSDEDIFK